MPRTYLKLPGRHCLVDGCPRPRHSLGYCKPHRNRVDRHGDPLAGGPDRTRSLADRLERFVNRTATCWLWTGNLRAGYGQAVGEDGRLHQAHRLVYEQLVGPVPDGLVLDHLCMVKACVRPSHLEPVTQGENLRRARLARAAA